ncbi:hypothetical protein DPMN_012342 [Dreissena polymorpha]|uniref:Uncharacterized protein n=1 Tax=Dreissena polymorpha TaxID=45954 RepID=A0A9D4N5T1_DREPO|nr:hypothetical protein DPMN_012342 [Dreissena polymorpha]
MRKSSSKTLQDLASRIQTQMQKAFPDIDGTETFMQLYIQHFLNGIPDQDLAYEVMKLSPKTLFEAVDSLTSLESCK